MMGLIGRTGPRMYDVGGKLLRGIISMYTNSLACVRVKVGDSECFKIENCVRQSCVMFPLSDERGKIGDRAGGSKVSGGGKRVEIA